jgi:hypothetical protein
MSPNPKCRDCQEDAGPNYWQAVVGFYQKRDKGLNSIALKSYRQAFLCDSCLRKRKRGHQGQESFFNVGG